MATNLHLSDSGIKGVLNSEAVARFVDRAAEAVAERVREHVGWDGLVSGIPGSDEMPVTVKAYTSDRERASVFLAHPAGLAVQAKHGALTKAAADLGLEVNG